MTLLAAAMAVLSVGLGLGLFAQDALRRGAGVFLCFGGAALASAVLGAPEIAMACAALGLAYGAVVVAIAVRLSETFGARDLASAHDDDADRRLEG